MHIGNVHSKMNKKTLVFNQTNTSIPSKLNDLLIIDIYMSQINISKQFHLLKSIVSFSLSM